MRRHRLSLLVVFTLLCSAGVSVAQEKRVLSFVDNLELPSLQDPQLSPDGKQVLFVMDRPDWKGNRRVGHIYRINTDGTSQVQLTFGERGESSPRWSPDGKSIAFTTRRDPDTNNQIYLLHTEGGEARRLTVHPTAPGSLAWSPDGKTVYFTATDAKSADEREKERLEDDVYAFEENNFKQRHLWTSDLNGKIARVTEGDWSAGGANAKQLTDNKVPESGASLSPDGATVMFRSQANEQFDLYYNAKLFLVPAAGGTARVLLPDVPYGIEEAAWSADGKSIYFTANMGVHNELMRVEVATKRVTQLSTGEHTIQGWTFNEAAGLHLFTRNTAQRPAEVHVMAKGAEPKRVTAVFDDTLAKFKVARQEKITWKGQDGVTVEGLLFYPVDYKAGQKYPLIVSTHGGPASSDRYGFSGDQQVYAGKGYAVLKPNYRGSTGYGDTFLRDMVGGYFKQSHLDVMLGTDAVIAMGVADPDKLVKMGWSAGGHMTNKIITFTNRFKVASSGAGAANWISMYAQSDHREFRTPWFGGTPWQANARIDLFWDHSPLKDVAKVKTPTIFVVGEEDPRVPTHLYVAPREGHGWTELRHRLFKLQIEMEWFEKHIHSRTYTWEKVPGDEKAPAKPTTTAG